MCYEYWRVLREKEAEEKARKEAEEAIRRAKSAPADEKRPVEQKEPAAV